MVLFHPIKGLARCYRCSKKKKGCSLSGFEYRASTNSDGRVIPGIPGFHLSLLQQIMAKKRKQKGLSMPKTPKDAVQMLRNIYKPIEDPYVDLNGGSSTEAEDYSHVILYSTDEWSCDEAHGIPRQPNPEDRRRRMSSSAA